ncbi:unnamed protein product [Effrenium voratum]|nr:unnamed protein product [Effrenium voratum]
MAHRDVKAENILWAGAYKLADFGTAARLEEPRRDECGTLWIMAPELLGRRVHGLSCDTWRGGEAAKRPSSTIGSSQEVRLKAPPWRPDFWSSPR